MQKVSVVIPAYNVMAYLPETLESVLRQTFSDFEVLIVNDGSSDNIVQWASGIQDPRVKLISQSNQGVSVARNTGIVHAQGEYIAFLDADDLWDSTKLEKQVSCLENNPKLGLVYTWTALIDSFGKPMNKFLISHAEGNVWEQMLVDDIICNGSSPMVRRSCFEKVGDFDPNVPFSEDTDMWIRIAAYYPFAVVKELLTFYRRHSHNATSSRQKVIQGIHRITEKSFQSVPLELLYLRNRKYGIFFHNESWTALIDEKNYQTAIDFHRQAFLHYPQILFSKNGLNLSIRILLLRLFGVKNYEKMRTMMGKMKQNLLKTPS
jgi:glycosyltransferase involved in cell wall biosynthesis